MTIVMPLGREKVTTVADFDAVPYGCACSDVTGHGYLTSHARGTSTPEPCACYCYYGDENSAANKQIGYESDF